MTVVIVGAGIAGLSLALALESGNRRVVVLERTPRLRDEGYMIDFFGVVLLGDACGAVSLVAAQGASLAMAGAVALAEELRAREDVEQALACYERRIRPAVARKQAGGRSLARWLVPEDAWKIRVRDLAVRASTWPLVSSAFRRGLDQTGIAALTGGAA